MKRKSVNVFLNPAVAEKYDQYYLSESGKTVDRYEKELFRHRLGNIPRLPMLELGCGTGHWTRFFADYGFQVTAVDKSKPMEKVMEEIDRVLMPGGWLLLGCLNALSELGKKKDEDEVFRYARFFSPEELKKLLARFGYPVIEGCVHLSENFELLDHTPLQDTVHPAFLIASVKKISMQKNNEH